jgi:hypothetical protein
MRPLVRLILLTLLCALPPALLASPGAHGPNGEHLDGPAAGSATSDGRPRAEGYSELFEFVAHLEQGALTMMMNVFETNVPVDGADVEVEFKGIKDHAKFNPVTGVYRFENAKLLQALSVPGKHPLAFNVTKGDDFDIVPGTLVVDADTHEHASGSLRWWLLGAGLLLAAALVVFLRRSRRRLAGARA